MGRRRRREVWAASGHGVPRICPACGAAAWLVERPRFGTALATWLSEGRGWPAEHRTCGACGYELPDRSFAILTARRRSPWSAPWRVIRALVAYRSCTPNPAIYFVGAGSGIVLGLILKLALGWPWWTVPIATAVGPGIVWLIFLSTGFGHLVRRAGPSGHGVKGVILQEIAPRRAAARENRLREEMWRHLPFEPFGLPAAWQGERWARGMSWSGSAVSSVELGFGREGDDNGPLLRVDTASNDRPSQRSLRTVAEELWWSAREMPRGLSPDQMAGWHHRRGRELAARAEPRWSRVVLLVDGRPVRFDIFVEGRWWVARGEAGDRIITIWGRSWPLDGLELVMVADIEPYVEGWRRLMERLRKEQRGRNAS